MTALTAEEIAVNQAALDALSKRLPTPSPAAPSSGEETEEQKARRLIDAAFALNTAVTEKEASDKAIADATAAVEAFEAKKKAAAFAAQGPGADFILKAFKAQYPNVEIEQLDGQNVLTFPTPEDALDFFKQQAALPGCPPFLAQKYVGKNPVDDYHFYCGVGPLLSGNKVDVEGKLTAALQAAIADKDNVKAKTIQDGLDDFQRLTAPNTTAQYRSALPREPAPKSTANADSTHTPKTKR